MTDKSRDEFDEWYLKEFNVTPFKNGSDRDDTLYRCWQASRAALQPEIDEVVKAADLLCEQMNRDSDQNAKWAAAAQLKDAVVRLKSVWGV